MSYSKHVPTPTTCGVLAAGEGKLLQQGEAGAQRVEVARRRQILAGFGVPRGVNASCRFQLLQTGCQVASVVQIGLDEFDTVGDSVKPPARAGGAHQCHDLLIRFDQLTHDLGADEPAGAGD